MNFVSAMIPRRSSTAPRATISVQVTKVATGSGLAACTSEKNGMRYETASPTTTPTYIARPPIVGVATGWTLRSFGWSIAPYRTTMRRTAGVARNVVAAQATKTIR